MEVLARDDDGLDGDRCDGMRCWLHHRLSSLDFDLCLSIVSTVFVSSQPFW